MSELRVKAPQELSEFSGRDFRKKINELTFEKAGRLIIDFEDTVYLDTLGCAWLLKIKNDLVKKNYRMEWVGESGKVKELLDVIAPILRAELDETAREKRWFFFSESIVKVVEEIEDFLNLCIDAIYWTIIAPLVGRKFRWELFVDELHEMGVRAVRIVCLMNFLLGLIIAMLSAAQVASFGLSIYVANLLMIGFARELAAIMTATIVSARTGASIAAEISTMKVQEEIDALRAMGINVVQYLVAPKVLALLIVLPCLSVLGLIFGLLGGSAWGIFVLDFSPSVWFRQTINSAYFGDLLQGLLKTFVFAVFIVLIGCHNGFRVTGGSRGVGLMTTRAVVMDVFMLIAVDIIFATIFYYILK
ncbi:MAG: ABC transporter permease [Candidatus Hydrogenedentes bacterium]|nr:ABC transporter permease [Candidatus Hydrogenedentota bacterium]